MIEYEHEGAFKEPLSSDKRSRYEFQSTGGQPQFRIPIRSDSVRFREAMAMDPCVPKLKVGSLLDFLLIPRFPRVVTLNSLFAVQFRTEIDYISKFSVSIPGLSLKSPQQHKLCFGKHIPPSNLPQIKIKVSNPGWTLLFSQ